MPISSENLITPLEYISMLQALGYEDVSVEDISEDVFPGFSKFLSGRGGKWWVFSGIISAWYRVGGRFVLASAQRPV